MITFDNFYNIREYLDILSALRYNDISYREFIDSRTKLWFIDIESTPTHKYDECENERYLVQKTLCIDKSEEHLFKRREVLNIDRQILNDCIKELGKNPYCYAFLANASEAQELSKRMEGKVWWFGLHARNKGVVVTEDTPIDIVSYVLVRPQAFDFDLEINKYLLGGKSFLRKYSYQPYFKDGEFFGFRGKRPYDY